MNIMKKTIIIAAALCLSLPGVKAWAQEEEPAPRSLVHISLITPLGTNGLESWNTVNHLSLNLFAGYSGGLDGLEVAGFANALKGDMRGIQVAGFCNNTFGDADGFEIAGFWNYNHRNVKGMQIAGFANLTRGTMEGIQVSGFINYAKVVKGLQIGYINIADTIESGMPIGFISFVKDGYRVVQIGGNETFMGEISYKSGIERFYNNIYHRGHRSPKFTHLGLGIRGGHHPSGTSPGGYKYGGNCLSCQPKSVLYRLHQLAEQTQHDGQPAPEPPSHPLWRSQL